MKKMDGKTRANVKNKSFDISKNQEFGRRPKTGEKIKEKEYSAMDVKGLVT